MFSNEGECIANIGRLMTLLFGSLLTSFGRWVMNRLTGDSTDVNIIIRALTEFISHFSFFHADCSGVEAFAFQRIVTDAVTVKGEVLSPVLTALVDQLRSFR